MPYLARLRYGVKSPDELPRPNVESPNCAARALGRGFLQSGTHNEKIFIDGRRRGRLELRLRPAIRDALTEIDCTFVTEAFAGFAGLGIQCEKASINCRVKDALVGFVLPA